MTERAVAPEWLDLLMLATRRSVTEAQRTAAISRITDWTTARIVARKHGVLRPFAALASDGNASIPDTEQAALAHDLECASWHSLRQSALVARLHRSLDQSRVPALFLKGPALSVLAYGDATARISADIDILTDRRSLERARIVLRTLGFRPKVEQKPTRTWEKYHESYESESGEQVELHWATATAWSPWRLSTRDWWHRRAGVAIAGAAIPTPSPERLVVYLAVHGLKHYWTRLGWVRDIGALTRADRQVDWDEVATYARRSGLQRPLGIALALSELVTAEPTPAAVAALASEPAARELAQTFIDRIGERRVLGAERWTELQLFLRAFDSPMRRLNRVAHVVVGQATKPVSLLWHRAHLAALEPAVPSGQSR